MRERTALESNIRQEKECENPTQTVTEPKFTSVTMPMTERAVNAANKPATMLVHAICSDRQYWLFSAIYICIHLPFYAVLFWLPQLINQAGVARSEWEVGLINALPWSFSLLAMYMWAANERGGNTRKWGLASTLMLCALGCYLATMPAPALAFTGICFIASGSAVAGNILWTIAQRYTDPNIAAVVFAMINATGALSGFLAPTLFGILEACFGSAEAGFRGLAPILVVTASLTYCIRLTRR